MIGLFSPLAVDERRQARGLDVELHGEEAYGSGEGAILVLPEPGPRAPFPAPRPHAAAPAAGKG